MNPASGYLRLAGPYTDRFGGVRWSPRDNVLELRDGSCFAFSEQVAEFLEGFGSVRPVLNFTHMVHLLALVRQEAISSPAQARLWRTFLDTGRNLRNAGAFFAHLCQELPEGLEADRLQEIVWRLRSHEQIVHWSLLGNASEPVHAPDLPAEMPTLAGSTTQPAVYR
jgi:hypothetical protein